MYNESSATLKPDEAHALLGTDKISRRAWYKAIGRGEVPHIRLGRRILIPRAKFLQWAGLEEPQETRGA